MEAYELLEREIEKWAEVENVVACASGTAALHLALESLGLLPGSEVIVPDLTMVACARAVVAAGLEPVFVDCGDDLQVASELVKQAIGERTRALMPVHVYGRTCDMGRLGGLAYQYKLQVVEDAAECHVGPLGPVGAARCWSFYRNKVVGGAEGGAVAFADLARAEIARSLRSLGSTERNDFNHLPRGWNHRLSNLHAQEIRNALRYVGRSVERRRLLEAAYEARCPREWRMPFRESPWVYDLRIRGMTAERQDAVVDALKQAGFQARHCFKPLHTQAEFVNCRRVLRKGADAGSRLLSREIIYLPLGVRDVYGPDEREQKARDAFDTIEKALKAPLPPVRVTAPVFPPPPSSSPPSPVPSPTT